MIIHGDSFHELKHLEADSIDFVCTDPPYGYSFMGKDWDKAVPSVEIWQQCLRVLKPGAFMCVMSAPRSDVQAQMIVRLTEAGFRLDFTPIYWTYASGFPKAGNIGKLVDKRNGTTSQHWKEYGDWLKQHRTETRTELAVVMLSTFPYKNIDSIKTHISNWELGKEVPTQAKHLFLKSRYRLDDRFDMLIEREEATRHIVGQKTKGSSPLAGNHKDTWMDGQRDGMFDVTISATDAAKALDGSYAGFQPKPAVEVIIVAMKPLSEKTYVDQALANGKGISWLDDGRIPFEQSDQEAYIKKEKSFHASREGSNVYGGNSLLASKSIHQNNVQTQGRFPANLIVSDDVLNDGVVTKGTVHNRGEKKTGNVYGQYNLQEARRGITDQGSYSRYFDLDKWYERSIHENLQKQSKLVVHQNKQKIVGSTKLETVFKTLPFLITPKASKSEKNKGLDSFAVKPGGSTDGNSGRSGQRTAGDGVTPIKPVFNKNHHPTVKPLKLMSYLITLFSRPGDTVLDPFCGSGSTNVAAHNLGRETIGIEREAEYVEIAKARLAHVKPEITQLPPEEPQAAEPPVTLETLTEPSQLSLL